MSDELKPIEQQTDEATPDTAVINPTAEAPASKTEKQPLLRRIKQHWTTWWANPKTRYGTLGGLVLIVIVLLAVPFTRYELLGLVLKSEATVTVTDKQTGQPVSGVKVVIEGRSLQTNANGKATVKTHLGQTTVKAEKPYYTTVQNKQTVTFSKQHNGFKIMLTALGRQVPVKVVNKVTGQPLANATLALNKSQTETDSKGLATLVVPPNTNKISAKLYLGGYNASEVTVSAIDTLDKVNTFSLVPAGKVYFLSNQSGKIDVVKSNLDGSNRETVLAGTGNEDADSTSLLASRDWKYLALLAKRSSGNDARASVYLIDTTRSDKLTTIDEGNAYFNLIGWSGHRFVFQVNREGYSNWQSGAQALKSYNAESPKLTTLDQTTAEGSSDYDYGFTNFSSVYILNNELVYTKWLYSSSYTNHLSGKAATVYSIKPDGSAKRSVKDFPVPEGTNYSYGLSLSLYEPYGVYVRVPNGNSSTFYEYEDAKLEEKPRLTDNDFNKPYATYLISPSGDGTFWSELRDGKDTLFVGDRDAKKFTQIASLSKYKPYGWYSDNYLLASKEGSELYIMPRGGSSNPLKVTDYYKPDLEYRNYGGGYGGI